MLFCVIVYWEINSFEFVSVPAKGLCWGCDEIIGRILYSALPLRQVPNRDGKRPNLRSERMPATELAVLLRIAHLVDRVQLIDFCRD